MPSSAKLIRVILYILYINPIGFPGEVTLTISDTIDNYWEKIGIIPDTLNNSSTLPLSMNSAKYMDDETLQEAIDLNISLAPNIDRSGPLPWYESSGKILPNQNTHLQSEINTIKNISDAFEMVLNPEKTKLLIVNFSKTQQFKSLLSIPSASTKIELTFETKLLGYWLTSDMKPDTHVKKILKTAYSRLWTISRLKAAKVNNNDIFYFYTMKIRSVLEYAAPVFSSMLTQKNTEDLEKIQKIVLKTLLNTEYSTYEEACILMNTTSLKQRRKDLSLNFALSCLENPQHRCFFKQRQSSLYNVRNTRYFEEPYCHTDRYYSSPLPYLTRLLNEHFKNKSI